MKAFLRSFAYASAGIAYVVRTQRNARVHIAIGLAVVLAGIGFRVSAVEWAILSLTFGLVFAAEIMNTVAEATVDLVTQAQHPLAKAAKDAAAGAVLVTALAAVGAGIAIFGPKLWIIVFR
jgi:diacylglycerol kinase